MAPFNVRCNAICPGNLLDLAALDASGKGIVRSVPRAGKVSGAKDIEDVRQAYTNQVPMKRGCSYDISARPRFPRLRPVVVYHRHRLSVTGGQEWVDRLHCGDSMNRGTGNVSVSFP